MTSSHSLERRLTRATARPWALVLIALATLLSACQSATPTMSLEEAKRTAVSFGGAPFVPPPRTITDVRQLLGPLGHGTDWTQIQSDAIEPGAIPTEAAWAYLSRARQGRRVGRFAQAIDDLTRASKLVTPDMRRQLPGTRQGWVADFGGEILRELGETQAAAGRYWDARKTYERLLIYSSRLNLQGRPFEARPPLVELYALTGDLNAADRLAAEQSADYYQSFSYTWPVPEQRASFESYTAVARAASLDARGRHVEAERFWRAGLIPVARFPYDTWLGSQGDAIATRLAECLLKQGRLVEAELEARKTLRSIASRGYGWEITTTANVLGKTLRAQGRYAEARALSTLILDAYERGGASARSSPAVIAPRLSVAATLAAEGQWEASVAQYEKARRDLDDAPLFQRLTEQDPTYAFVLVRSGRLDEASTVVTAALEHLRRVQSKDDAAAAELRGLMAVIAGARGDVQGAVSQFGAITNPLLARSAVGQEATSRGERNRIRSWIVSMYIEFLHRLGTGASPAAGTDAAAEAFRLADAVLGRFVQGALDAAAARNAARTPALADLIRREQDAAKQISALQGVLTTAYDRPGNFGIVVDLTARIERLQAARQVLVEQIAKEFPVYGQLVNPPAMTAKEARAALRSGESLIMTLVTENRTYVWALPQNGPLAFAAVPLGEKALVEKVNRLRKALDPRVEMLRDVPAYDVELAHELYRDLLEPVKAGWVEAEKLLIVGHGPLGQLPFHALVTQPVTLDSERAPLFSAYRRVPWLVRRHAVATVPSVGALVTLRRQPPGPADRKPFVGFGDPYFSIEQARDAAHDLAATTAVQHVATATSPDSIVRGMRLARRDVVVSPGAEVETSQLAMLPRLPDTAEEIRSIARVMNADLTEDVFLGERANERTVTTLDLTKYRVIAFATHGLVPGDIDGLTQPALALTAPEIAKIDGDGLLTMDKILALRLDADWVVLSACNTANGAGAGAEAISGLGRAFFYAGARALLVTHWPVETTSARLLTTELFKRQAADSSLSRAKALQQTMNYLIDEGGIADPETKQQVFSFAHSIFWAPFALVGDGG